MATPITLKKVNDLLGLNFFIPCYQRGYRWTSQQVNDLLDDILEFSKKKNNEEFYCLQPIVLKSCDEKTKSDNSLNSSSDNNNWYEVIDGQQRLTTILLLIHYFNEMWVGKQKNPEFTLEYATRENTSEFLKNINILDGPCGPCVQSCQKTTSNIDFYYISEAYKTIDNWAKEQGTGFDSNDFQSVFKMKTQVIWYELPQESDPIESFTRINIGKIPLTNAELIKALFLQKRNFTNAEVELRQIELAKEWDSTESSLQKSDFWAFLNEKDNPIPARINFLFDVIYRVEKDKDKYADKKYGTDQYATFRYFNAQLQQNVAETNSVFKLWDSIKEYHAAFEDWFNHKEWYHYIGYLIWAGFSIDKIYKLYAGSLKSEFTENLKREVMGKLGSIEYFKEEDNYYHIDISYDDKKSTLRSLLLLYNIEFLLQKKENNYYRFPFDLFKNEQWDIEHISSQTTNELNKTSDQEAWLNTALEELDATEKEDFDTFVKNIPPENFEDKRNWIVKKVGEDSISEDFKNRIGNLTLLNSSINKSYRNSIFPVKRKVIIKKDESGSFIPICTKNVFLKYFTGGNILRWSESDIKKAENHIVEVLKYYLEEK